jgi:hypothetical protein
MKQPQDYPEREPEEPFDRKLFLGCVVATLAVWGCVLGLIMLIF